MLSLSEKFFRQAAIGIYKEEMFVNPFLLNAKGHPDGFLSLFSSLRSLQIDRFIDRLTVGHRPAASFFHIQIHKWIHPFVSLFRPLHAASVGIQQADDIIGIDPDF